MLMTLLYTLRHYNFVSGARFIDRFFRAVLCQAINIVITFSTLYSYHKLSIFTPCLMIKLSMRIKLIKN